ncbi:thiamine phosphate synthase [Flavobacterium crassostreae]|uniref:Thiamine-phosphate synthase n=1 Tax=Flavobacterium crassostreae TaxID=1763534 RepID=A0A1B9E4K8_9FLAO|nr:thiamine phosphate synthase [Flavobacterium crassostreae]OCB76894.1 thiamine phosphate synthase [Flavobacterium crassostreae]
MFNKLQYISQGSTVAAQLNNIHLALDNGCHWIQMRFKSKQDSDTFALAEAVKILCQEYLAHLIINDNVALAKHIAADGVHLGLTDMPIDQARNIFGATKIIGATANSFEDIQKHIQNGCDYIGLGPYQFTTTKENLSPVLGLEGYRSILTKMHQNGLSTPVYAIGGITLNDVQPLMQTGVYGIAVSGLITHCSHPKKTIKQLKNNLYGNLVV